MAMLKNWAGNYQYSTTNLHTPDCLEAVQQLVSSSNKLKVLGTRHSFNHIADSTKQLISLSQMNKVISLDKHNKKVTVEAGITYGDLAVYLNNSGLALHNMASLPHISIAGACATATHGSGDHNGCLSTAVSGMEVVTASGDIVNLTREQQGVQFKGAVVGLGGLGIVTKLTLDLVPEYQIRQDVYLDLHMDHLKEHLNEILSSAYSVSLFTDWKASMINQVWVKNRLPVEDQSHPRSELYGAKLATTSQHPVQGMATENCTQQLGIPGPWHERLPHFRMDFTPSKGAELQSEYIIPRSHAYEAICAIDRLKEHIAPLLYISEVRTVAADDLWMSPFNKQDSIGIHFTWIEDWTTVARVLPLIEEQLAPFHVRPHWGKLFTMSPQRIQSLYAQLPEFRELLQQYDPQGKFRNAFLDTYIFE